MTWLNRSAEVNTADLLTLAALSPVVNGMFCLPSASVPESGMCSREPVELIRLGLVETDPEESAFALIRSGLSSYCYMASKDTVESTGVAPRDLPGAETCDSANKTLTRDTHECPSHSVIALRHRAYKTAC